MNAAHDATPQGVDGDGRLVGLVAFLAILAGALIVHLYLGIFHDSILYTIQALAHSDPALYARDLYIRFGSQDRFSVFAPIYAWLLRPLGVEHAASVLTLGGQVLLVLAAWRLARRLVPARWVPLALALLVSMPGVYGSRGIFRLMEDFVTPRIFSEALVLAALAGWQGGRRGLAVLLIAAALPIHPLMAMAGVVMIFWLAFGLDHRRAAALFIGLAFAAVLVLGLLTDGPPWQFDPAWLDIAHRSPFVFLERWSASDWGANLVSAVTLLAALPLASESIRRLLLASLLSAALGMALAWLGGDRLHLVLIIQGQPWRWMWIVTCLSLLILPWLAAQLWQRGALGRAGVLLLIADYLLLGQVYVLPLLALTLGVLALCLYAPRIDPRRQRLVLLGAGLLTAIAAAVALGAWVTAMGHHRVSTELAQLPPWVRMLREGTQFLYLVPALVVLLILAAQRAGEAAARRLLAALAAAACVLVIPSAWAGWTHQDYGAAERAQFAAWRALIPAGADVLCPQSPLFAWLLLERPSYLSQAQESSQLFSRAAALEVEHRVTALRGFPDAIKAHLAAEQSDDPAAGTLEDLCAKVGSEMRFVVAFDDLKAAPIAIIAPTSATPYSNLKLYACPVAPVEPRSSSLFNIIK
jgi:hypothetical protein